MCSVTQTCPTLCNPIDCNLPGSSFRGILQARILEWVTIPGDIPDPGDLPNLGIESVSPMGPELMGGFFITEPTGKSQSLG